MAFDNIHNYYEHLVLQRLNDMMQADFIEKDPNFLEDVACVALNHLPPRYIRHEVDMIFYLSPVEREEMEQKVLTAIEDAISFIKENRTKSK